MPCGKEIALQGFVDLTRYVFVIRYFRAKALTIVAARAKQDGVSLNVLINQLEEEDDIPSSFLLRHLYNFSTLEMAVPS